MVVPHKLMKAYMRLRTTFAARPPGVVPNLVRCARSLRFNGSVDERWQPRALGWRSSSTTGVTAVPDSERSRSDSSSTSKSDVKLRDRWHERKYVIAWFRADLRVRDNPILLAAIRAGKGHVLPVYCFDPRSFGLTDQAKFPKCAAPRAQFLRECVEDLRNSLRALGSDLIVRHGRPEVVLSELAEQYGCSQVFGSKEVARDETRVEKKLNASLAALENPPELTLRWGASTMFHLDDLPFALEEMTRIYDVFANILRAEASKPIVVRSPLLPPAKGALQPLPEGLDRGIVPSLDELLKDSVPDAWQRHFERDMRAVIPFHGGESAAIARVRHFLWEKDYVSKFMFSRTRLKGDESSSKLAPWLAHGCVSARDIYHEVRRYERTRAANRSTKAFVQDLMWRDYFRFLALRLGNVMFSLRGPRRRGDIEWGHDRVGFEAWRTGNTGYPLVDASMRELNRTGYMSGRGRRNVASFLVHELGIDWRWGAEWFESRLLDYDVHSNYGNWTYSARVGLDPREDVKRRCNVVKQGMELDVYREFAQVWLPMLAGIPREFMYSPYRLTGVQRAEFPNVDRYALPIAERKPVTVNPKDLARRMARNLHRRMRREKLKERKAQIAQRKADKLRGQQGDSYVGLLQRKLSKRR
ncbi:Cryptochrome DASH, chloroplastic/mitochondrial [Porphyridium purpureum]|uniref:Cryptochrome DASH n=1 Tax=Porphyridium purpureum TaxID=35688 RepID=A0A5J4YRD2_PORPP|nr:Cryptochrome DASH, chloroplastic/mitochondrial [Porphyridium purpureum]|eukprot:POR3952..scf236_6